MVLIDQLMEDERLGFASEPALVNTVLPRLLEYSVPTGNLVGALISRRSPLPHLCASRCSTDALHSFEVSNWNYSVLSPADPSMNARNTASDAE